MIGYLTLEYRLRKLEAVIDGKLPKYFYHGTTTSDAEQILKNGLKPSKLSKRIVHSELTNKNKVYLTDSLSSAKGWAVQAAENAESTNNDTNYNPNEYSVLRIDSKFLDPDLLEADHNAYGKGKSTKQFSFNIDDNGKPDCEFNDFEYKGSIPPEAISLVWKSDSATIAEVNKLIKSGNLDAVIKNWNKYKDADLGTSNFTNLFTKMIYKLTSLDSKPDWSNNKFKKIILSLPPEILNHETNNLHKTVLNALVDIDPLNDNIADIMLDLAKKFGNKLSDLNIKLLWECITDSVLRDFLDRNKVINIIKKLPDSFLKIGKSDNYINKIENSDIDDYDPDSY